MDTNSPFRPSWGLGIALGALALVRPAIRIVEDLLGVDAGPPFAIGLTVAITIVWVLVVGLSRAPAVATLGLAGLTYGVLAIITSAVLSPMLTGSLQGPIANPIAIVPMLLLNVGWGLLAGLVALGMQRLRRPRRASTSVIMPTGRR